MFVPAGDGAYVLVAHPSAGVATVTELIATAKAKPGQIAYASSSTGNLTHLAAELFNSMAGVKMLHVPYKGGGPAMLDLLGRLVAVFFSTVAVARPHIQSGKIKALGATTGKRSTALPNLPTIAEAGLPGYDVSGWYGIVRVALRQPEIKDKLLALGAEASDVNAAQFDKFLRADLLKWAKVAKPLSITME